MVNIAICGANGKMGRMVYSCALERDDINVVCGVDVNTNTYADFPIYEKPSMINEKVDVIVDYSHPSALSDVLSYALTNGIAVIFATTGYSEQQIAEIKKASEQIPIFFTFNMSLGINLLCALAKKATEVLGNQFDIEIIEKHHNLKIDAPSGTAIMLANAINETLDNRMNYEYDRHSRREKRKSNEIGMHSVRGGTIVGEHEIIFAGKDEVISLKHEAHSKQVFAVGSLNAASFLKGKPAGLYDMSSVV
ncbi:MAG: 4-hydroxy-tetrahydrodipicolinate reductase [Oscillospiraceae bacterium]|nr:4-hydroxy-tetrahydrodipicolinate reductase [Oscillospiraceae bacterium]